MDICKTLTVVYSNVALLIGSDLLDKYQVVVDNVRNVSLVRSMGRETPLSKNFGYHYFLRPTEYNILYTYNELRKTHKNVPHSSADKLLNLLKPAGPWETNDETKSICQDITSRCNTCQYFVKVSIRFRVSLPTEENFKFGEKLSMDLVFLDGKAVLHLVYTANRFSAATFLDVHSEILNNSRRPLVSILNDVVSNV